MQIDVAQFPELVLDNATFLLAHRRRAAVQPVAFQHPVDRRGRGYRVALLAQDGMDLVAVHAPLAMGDDLGLDAFRLAPFPPFRAAPARQQVRLLAALQIAVVILAERLRAGSVMPVEVADPLEQRRSASLHRLILRDQKTPLLQDSSAQSSGRSCCRASDRPPVERFNQRISEHAQLRGATATKQSISGRRCSGPSRVPAAAAAAWRCARSPTGLPDTGGPT